MVMMAFALCVPNEACQRRFAPRENPSTCAAVCDQKISAGIRRRSVYYIQDNRTHSTFDDDVGRVTNNIMCDDGLPKYCTRTI